MDKKNFLGFLTVSDCGAGGLVGGFLVLNFSGRPIEFHCTAPVRPKRAQEILYGTTFPAFLYGEQIAQALISKVKTPLLAVVTNLTPVLTIQEELSLPLMFVSGTLETVSGLSDGLPGISGLANAVNLPNLPDAERWTEKELGEQRLWFPTGFSVYRQDENLIDEQFSSLSGTLNFLEPFERILLAIQEAQKN